MKEAERRYGGKAVLSKIGEVKQKYQRNPNPFKRMAWKFDRSLCKAIYQTSRPFF